MNIKFPKTFFRISTYLVILILYFSNFPCKCRSVLPPRNHSNILPLQDQHVLVHQTPHSYYQSLSSQYNPFLFLETSASFPWPKKQYKTSVTYQIRKFINKHKSGFQFFILITPLNSKRIKRKVSQ